MKEITANMKNFIVSSFENDKELRNILFEYNMEELSEEDSLETFFYEIANLLFSADENRLFNKGYSAVSIYEAEYSKYEKDILYYKQGLLYSIEKIIKKNFSNKEYSWVIFKYKKLYIQILSSYLHSSVKNFFFENRKRFLPEYDWFIIEKDNNRKIHIEAFFKEFDRFSTVIDSISNYTDLDKIPQDYLSYMSSILGIKMITEQGITSHNQIRSVLGNMVSVFKNKGSIGALELFLGSLGIGINLNEMFFDRRMYWYHEDDEQFKKNTYTNVLNHLKYAYYLTPNNPTTTFYPLSPKELVSSLSNPLSESYFNEQVKKTIKETGVPDIKKILGYAESVDNLGFKYFKTNTVIIEFYFYQSKEQLISLSYQRLLEEYMSMIIPVYVRKYYPSILFEETSFEDSLSFVLYGASEYSFVNNELYRVENMDNYSLHLITPDRRTENWEPGSCGEEVEEEFLPIDKYDDDISESLNQASRTETIQINTLRSLDGSNSEIRDDIKLPVVFSVPNETEEEQKFKTKDINIVENYGFLFNPEITLFEFSIPSSGGLNFANFKYNSINKIYLLEAGVDEGLEIEIT